MEIPRWANRHLRPGSAETIAEAVKAAEMKTTGEVVPMLVRRSSTIGHVPFILTASMVAVFMVVDGPGWQAEYFGAHWTWYLVDTLGLLVAAALLARVPFVQRLLTVREDMTDQVNMRAEVEFYESHMHQTRDATGILLFVSMMEHRAVVLADEAIDARVPGETWEEVCALLVAGIRNGDIAAGFATAIGRCGDILAAEFPVKTDDTNELFDHLVIKD